MNSYSHACPIPGRQARLPSDAANWAPLESATSAECSCLFTPLDWNMRITLVYPLWNASLANTPKDRTPSLMLKYKTHLHPLESQYLTGSSISVYHKRKDLSPLGSINRPFIVQTSLAAYRKLLAPSSFFRWHFDLPLILGRKFGEEKKDEVVYIHLPPVLSHIRKKWTFSGGHW